MSIMPEQDEVAQKHHPETPPLWPGELPYGHPGLCLLWWDPDEWVELDPATEPAVIVP